MPAAVQERLIRLWAGPQGAVKAAMAGAGIGLMAMDRNLGRLLKDGTATIGQTSVAWEGSKPVVTYPIPGVAGATAKATLDNRYMAERVVVTQGSTTTEFVYSNYQDWNNPLNKIEAYYAGKIDRAARRHHGPRSDDGRDGDRQRLRGHARARQRSAAITPGQAAPPRTLFPSDRTVALQSKDPTPRLASWETGSDGQLGRRRHELALRQSPMRSDADRRLQPAVESDDGLRVRGAVAVRAESPVVQARALGQGRCARHVDEQGRSSHDLSTARDSAARRAAAHRPVGE